MDLKIRNSTTQLSIFLVATIFGALLFGILGNLSALFFLDINTFSDGFTLNSLTISQQVDLFRLTQPFNTLGIFLFPPLAIKYLLKQDLGFNYSEYRISYLWIISVSLLIFMVKPIVASLSEINNSIDFVVLGETGKYLMEISKELSDKITLITQSNSIGELTLNMVIIALLPAIAEEFFFRGFIQNFLFRISNNYHLSIWITAITFGMIHFNVTAILPLIFLGAILGYIYYYSQNIWISILAHFVNNASLLWFVYKYSFELNDVKGQGVSYETLIFSIVMSSALLFFMFTVWKQRTSGKDTFMG